MAWRYAAAACMLACIATVFFLVHQQDKVKPQLAANTEDTSQQLTTMVLNQPKDTHVTAPIIVDQTPQETPVKPVSSKNNYTDIKQPRKEKQIIKRQITIDPGQLLVQDVERNYTQLVNYQLERLKVTPVYAESPNYFSTFKQQLRQIEADETSIKKDIKLHGLNDELLQQLININQQKLTVLKDLQAEINKLNNKVKSPATRADSSQAYYLTM